MMCSRLLKCIVGEGASVRGRDAGCRAVIHCGRFERLYFRDASAHVHRHWMDLSGILSYPGVY
jgi:hypothetical protein